jgi:hypothetical protein
MLKINSPAAGILVALIFPALAWLTEYLLKNNIYIINKPALPYFIAIALNLILVRISLKKGFGQAGRGLMLATFVLMALIFIFKIHPLR